MYLQVFVYFKITPHNMRKHARSISVYADIWRDNDTNKTCFWPLMEKDEFNLGLHSFI